MGENCRPGCAPVLQAAARGAASCLLASQIGGAACLVEVISLAVDDHDHREVLHLQAADGLRPQVLVGVSPREIISGL